MRLGCILLRGHVSRKGNFSFAFGNFNRSASGEILGQKPDEKVLGRDCMMRGRREGIETPPFIDVCV